MQVYAKLTGEIMNFVFENTPILNLLVYVDWNGHTNERFYLVGVIRKEFLEQ